MKNLFLCLASLSLAVGTPALAEGRPAPDGGSGCPLYTSSSGGWCVPHGDHQVIYTGEGGRCPVGWTKSRSHCVR